MSQPNMEVFRQKFLTKLAGNLPAFSQFVEQIGGTPPTSQDLTNIRMAVHQIAGTAKTFGFENTSEHAATVESLIDRLLSTTEASHLNHPLVLTKLQQAFDALSTHAAELIQSQRRDDIEQAPRVKPSHLDQNHYKVLVADDDALVRDLLKENLETQGCEVIEVASGQDVMPQTKLHQPNLIIQDVNMPDLSGFEVLRALKANESTRPIPVMMLTKRSEDMSIVEGIASGAADYTIKPFDVDKFVARIMAALKRTDVKILIADDDPAASDLVAMRLSKLGYRVIVVNNGEETLAKFEDEAPNLLLLDIMMPGVDGMAILKQIKTQMQSDTPVVVVTAKKQSENIVKSFDDGAHDYIVKPFDIDELVARVRAILRRQQHPVA